MCVSVCACAHVCMHAYMCASVGACMCVCVCGGGGGGTLNSLYGQKFALYKYFNYYYYSLITKGINEIKHVFVCSNQGLFNNNCGHFYSTVSHSLTRVSTLCFIISTKMYTSNH